MLLSELACRLRDQYQDYADYVVNQLTVIADEDGDIDNRAHVPHRLRPSNPDCSVTHELERLTPASTQRFQLALPISSDDWQGKFAPHVRGWTS